MADMEMEVETGAHVAPVDMDEDLIDYDIETENPGHGEDTMEIGDDSWANEQSAGVMEDFDFDIDVDGPRPADEQLPEAEDHDDEMEMTESVHNTEQPDQPMSKEHEEEQISAIEPTETDADAQQETHVADRQEIKIADAEAEAEISYEDVDAQGSAPTATLSEDEVRVLEEPTEEQVPETLQQDSKVSGEPQELAHESLEGDALQGTTRLVEDLDKHEVAQETSRVEEPVGEDGNQSSHQEQDGNLETDADEEHAATEQEQQLEDEKANGESKEETSLTGANEGAASDNGDAEEGVREKVTEPENVESVQEPEGQDASELPEPLDHPSQQPSEQGDVMFPDVKVHYKDEEYSLCSLGHDGFFTETSCLDEDMGALLAKLRVELAGEISQEDEVVLQLDEMGLEFSESLSPSVLSATTLNQILDIFELLVKNQDPDGTRTLYCYLFTKPCPTRRLELLSESAAAGKGLEEVTHVYNPPTTQNADNAESVESGDGLEGDFAHEEEIEHHLSQADVDDEQQQGEDEEDADDFDAYNGEAEGAARHDDDQLAEDQEVEQQSTAAEQPLNPTLADGVVEPTEDSSLAGLDNDDFDRDANETNLDDFIPAPAVPDSVEPKGTEEATNHDDPRLQNNEDEDEGSSHTEGVDALETENNGANGTHADASHDDELEEIDWRDDAEPGEAIEETASVTGKRSRADDELASEDQEAKRQRS